MEAREAIYIGNRILAHDKSDFLRALDDLARQVTGDRLVELGEELTTDTLRDILQGGKAIRDRMANKMTNSLKAMFFPAERRQRQEIFGILDEQLTMLCREAEYTLQFYRNIPVDAYIVREDGTVGYDENIIDRYFEEQEKIYISNPQQIEVYGLAIQIRDALEKLSELLPEYGLHVSDVIQYDRFSEKVKILPERICEAWDGGRFVPDAK
jgi:hypothetical protein